ncbi:MAG: hypothetical protein AAF560_07570 [Acidobacteriota bacterium]
MDQTVTVLTIDLPPQLSDRLRAVHRKMPHLTVRDITVQALAEWLDRHEASAGSS